MKRKGESSKQPAPLEASHQVVRNYRSVDSTLLKQAAIVLFDGGLFYLDAGLQ